MAVQVQVRIQEHMKCAHHKWSPDADKASLGAAQAALSEILAEVRAPSQVLILVRTPPHLPLGHYC